MRSPTTTPQWVAIAAGVAATGGALTILLWDVRATGWTLEHTLLPIIVGITIAIGWLAERAIADRRLLSAVGFAFLFLLGTGLTVYASVGRQAETAESKALTALDHNDALEKKRAELARARQRLAEANTMADRETGQGGCKRVCEDWKLRAREVESHIRKLEAEVRVDGPRKPTAGKAERAAQVLSLFGLDERHAAAVIAKVEPVTYALFFEIAAIVAFGFGFAPARPVKVANDNRSPSARDTAQTSFPVPPPSNGGTPVTIPENHPVIVALNRARRPLTNDELAEALGVHKGTASKWRTEVADHLDEVRDGRFIRVTLKRAV